MMAKFGLIFLVMPLIAAAALAVKRHPPSLAEDDPSRKTMRSAECQFGKQVREMNSTWFADLGPPFGVMYCIKCECVPVQKKRRVVAKVQCRNIKSECPIPTCDQPLLLPGRCCKACPGDSNSPDVLNDIPLNITAEEEERSMKHFAALLSSRSPLVLRRDDMSAIPAASGVATARLSFRRRHLFYALTAAAAPVDGGDVVPGSGPHAVQFLDRAGRVLIEHSLTAQPGMHSTYQNATGKLCGVWRRVSREYRRLLREGAMYIALLWGENGNTDYALSGLIDRYPALSTEMFTALLEPEGVGGWGGTAIITATTGATPSVHIAAVFNGIFAPNDMTNVPVTLRFEVPDKNLTVFEEIKTLSKAAHEINIIEVSSPVSLADVRTLSRGKAVITLESSRAQHLRVKGSARPRASCEIYQTVMVSERLNPVVAHGAGMAWMYIDQEGSLVYNLMLDELNTVEPPLLTLVDESGRRHSQVEFLEVGGGVLVRPSARLFAPLYDEQVWVVVGGAIKGRLTSRLLGDGADSGAPVLLMRAENSKPIDAVGMAWITVDTECSLHYEIMLSGPATMDTTLSGTELYLELLPALAPGAVARWMQLDMLNGGGGGGGVANIEGMLLEPSPTDMARLHNGAVFLHLRTHDNTSSLLKAQLQQIHVPTNCLPQYYDNEVPVQSFAPSHSNSPADKFLGEVSSCFHSGRFYDDGAQWTSAIETCTMCGCISGHVRCDAMKCPSLSCTPPAKQRPPRPGECCPTCVDSSAAEWNASSAPVLGCLLAGQFHVAGSSWHPYLVPGGFDSCAVCSCDERKLTVKCPRVPCPPLPCPERLAYRPDKTACCRVCPEAKPPEGSLTADGADGQGDQGIPKTHAEVLAEGGCRYPLLGAIPNGKEWHPTVHSHGEQKCVTCRCKDGVVKCERKRCPRSICTRRLTTLDDCCQQHCRRHRRHQRPRRRQNRRQQKNPT